jgi:hypothetical protein
MCYQNLMAMIMVGEPIFGVPRGTSTDRTILLFKDDWY